MENLGNLIANTFASDSASNIKQIMFVIIILDKFGIELFIIARKNLIIVGFCF